MKKIILLGVVVLGAISCYLYLEKNNSLEDKVVVEMSKESAEASTQEASGNSKNKPKDTKSDVKKATQDGVLVFNADFIKEQSKWKDEMKSLFSTIGSSDKMAFEDYRVLKEGFEEDRTDAYDRILDEVRNGVVEISITEIEEAEYDKIQKEYFRAFEKRYGRDLFVKYLKKMEDFNDRLSAKEGNTLQMHF